MIIEPVTRRGIKVFGRRYKYVSSNWSYLVCSIVVWALIHLFNKRLSWCSWERTWALWVIFFLNGRNCWCLFYTKAALKALTGCRVWAEDCPLIWRELIFHSVRSGGLAVAVSLFSTVLGSCAMPPTLLWKELKHYSAHKDTKQQLTAQWAGADSQPNIWWCSKIQAAAVLQQFRLHCCGTQPGFVLRLFAS